MTARKPKRPAKAQEPTTAPDADETVTLPTLINRLELLSWKLDLAVDHYGDLSNTVDTDLGAATVVKEVAEGLSDLYCRFNDLTSKVAEHLKETKS